MKSYDQWKTASPDDEIDDSYCRQCGIKIPETSKEEYVYEGFCSQACMTDHQKYQKSWPMIRPLLNFLCKELNISTEDETPDSIVKEMERQLENQTSCGAWFRLLDNHTIEIGSIVEGSDAEVETDPLSWPFTEKEFKQTLEYIEAEANFLWKEANEG